MYSLLAANTISLIGSSFTVVALPWFVLQTTGSASKAGLVGLSVALPRILAGVFGGTIVDRLGLKQTSVAADAISGASVALIPLLYHTVGLAFWQLLSLVFVGNLLNIPGTTARRAILPELAELAQIRLERINSAFESIQYLSRLLGAPLAGLLIALLGSVYVLWIDAATFVISAVLVGALVPTAASLPVAARAEGYWRQLAAGFRFLRNDRVLFWMAIALLISNAFGLALVPVILPVYADQFLGSATALGLMVSAIGVGGVIGSCVYGAVAYRLPRRTIWLLAFLVAPLEYWVLLAHPPLFVIIAALIIVGLAFGPFNPVMVTIRQERVPLAMRGRVFSLFSAMSLAAQPLGMAFAGFAIEAVGFNLTVLLFAIALQGLSVVLLFIPTLRDMDATKAP